MGADKDFFFRAFRRSDPTYVPEPVILYRLHDSNLSGMVNKETGEWVGRPENISRIRYLEELLRDYRREIEEPKKAYRRIRLLNIKEGDKSMKKIEKGNFSKGCIGKSGSGDNRMLEGSSQAELLLEQIGHMAEVIDRLRLQIKEQQMAIIAKDQHITNLERFIRNLTMEIVEIKKYSVFYNLLSRFRRELLKVFGKNRK